MDPIELRRKNLVAANATTLNGLRVTSNGAAECLARVEASSRWKERRGKLGYGKGLGVAVSAYISGTNYCIYPNAMPQSAVQLKVDRSGVVTVFSGQSEIGQGCDLLLAVLVADELGLDLGAVRVLSGDTDLTPVDLGAYSSRGTFMNGNAALHAAQQVRTKMVDAVAEKLGVTRARGARDPWRARRRGRSDALRAGHRGDPARRGQVRHASARPATTTRRSSAATTAAAPSARRPPTPFTAHVAEVEVDPETGMTEVKTIWVAHDCGKAICPTLVDGQIEGSAYMGAAEAILEEHVIGKDGLHMGPNLLD